MDVLTYCFFNSTLLKVLPKYTHHNAHHTALGLLAYYEFNAYLNSKGKIKERFSENKRYISNIPVINIILISLVIILIFNSFKK